VIRLFYESGTLVATGASGPDLPEAFVWDARTRQWRAPANAYRDAVMLLREDDTPHQDLAADFERLSLESRVALAPRPYQKGRSPPGVGRTCGASSYCRPGRARRRWRSRR
jgi:hypothetical protein